MHCLAFAYACACAYVLALSCADGVQVITLVFEKALGDLFFQDMYAELCTLLSNKSGEWCQGFLQVAEKDAECGETGVTTSGWYFTAAGEGEEVAWSGPFETEEVARTQGSNQTSFKRLLLNKCQQQFMQVLGVASPGPGVASPGASPFDVVAPRLFPRLATRPSTWRRTLTRERRRTTQLMPLPTPLAS